MRITKAHKLMATTIVTSMVMTMCIVAPLSAQSTQGMDQGSTQSNPCVTTAQGGGQSMTQSSNNSSSQNTSQSSMIGTGPDNAGAPLDCWLTLNVHQSHWYKFRYGFNPDQDDTPDQATVRLSMDTPGCISFEVWTQDRLNAVQNGVTDDNKLLGPVGTGSPEYAAIERDSSSDKNQNPAKLIWVGSQTGSTTFYVVVKNHRDFACTYRLSISGFSVSFPSNANSSTTNG